MGVEHQDETVKDKEIMKKENQEVKDTLNNFGNGGDKDKKLLDDPQFGNKAVGSIKEGISEKSKNINDPESKKQIEGLSKEIDGFSKLGKLNEDQIKQLQSIYQKIEAIEGTEHAEDAQSGDETQKKGKDKQTENAKKLLEATESLRDFMKGNSEQQQDRQKEQAEKGKNAREEGEKAQKIASVEAEKILGEWPYGGTETA